MEQTLIVIFGASGDLTKRKLIPALYHLFTANHLPENFAVLGVSRTNYTDDTFRKYLIDSGSFGEKEESVEESCQSFCQHLYYHRANPKEKSDFPALKKRIEKIAKENNCGRNILYYFAAPPVLYSAIAENLSANQMNRKECGAVRIVIEKPFGCDLNSARKLDTLRHSHFAEEQIYRIDHYLGKETVQNLLVFRFANTMFEPIWNHNYIDHIEITGAEFLGVEKRGGYYEGSGAVRDMLQNHLLQVLSIVAMEVPSKINAGFMRDEAVKVMHCFRPLTEKDLRENVILGQYTASNIRGQQLKAYRDEEGVAANSRTETYAALKMYIDNWRWSGVPFYLRTGKRMPTRVTEIVLYLKKTPHPFFTACASDNKIIIRIQPDEGILINFGLKKPGAGFSSTEVGMDFHYKNMSDGEVLDAYARLLLDAIKGDATLFARSDAVEACWEFVQPILEYKKEGALYGYAAGTWGPEQAHNLLAKDKREWRFPCRNLAHTDYCEL